MKKNVIFVGESLMHRASHEKNPVDSCFDKEGQTEAEIIKRVSAALALMYEYDRTAKDIYAQAKRASEKSGIPIQKFIDEAMQIVYYFESFEE